MRSTTEDGVGMEGARFSGENFCAKPGSPAETTRSKNEIDRIVCYCKVALAVADRPTFDFTIRPMISVHAKNKSRGLLMVNSAPFRNRTALPMASRQGFTCGLAL